MQNVGQAKSPSLFILYSGAEIESAKMSEHDPKLYFRVAFIALLLHFASGERSVVYNVSTS